MVVKGIEERRDFSDESPRSTTYTEEIREYIGTNNKETNDEIRSELTSISTIKKSIKPEIKHYEIQFIHNRNGRYYSRTTFKIICVSSKGTNRKCSILNRTLQDKKLIRKKRLEKR